ncbi:MAG: diaminopimelate decarboxylase [Firmicutes bacterium]|nr:diaminopimelate decarboxylase [Bacillota bacterium]
MVTTKAKTIFKSDMNSDIQARLTPSINNKGHLVLGECDCYDLVKEFGTPLYALDQQYIEYMSLALVNTAKKEYPNSLICYASKAMCCKALYQLVSRLGLGVDVASGGELYTAIIAGVDPNKIYVHGNAKTVAELSECLVADVHAVVIDSLDEIETLNNLALNHGKIQGVLVRVNPGVEAHTHEYIQTAKVDSKFGFSVANGTAKQAINVVNNKQNLKLLGLHCHIGSQIFDTTAFELAVDKMTDFMVELKNNFKIEIEELNMGGGFGVIYTDEDKPLKPEIYVRNIVGKLKECIEKKSIKPPRLILEPGRSIVGEAGITLYNVTTVKEIPNVRKYIAVNGGMFENPRHALYQSKYTATLALKANEPKTETVTIAGKCCESGDILARDLKLQRAEKGDVLAVLSTGAYNYSMASNYNRNLIPPVILCNNGKAKYIVKPQTYEDLVARDEDL